MLSWRERLKSENKIDKISVLVTVISFLLLCLTGYFGIKNYENYSENFYYYGYVFSIVFTLLTIIWLTQDYYNSGKIHISTLKHFVLKVNPPRSSLFTMLLRIGLEWVGGLVFLIYFLGFVLTIIISLSESDARPFLFVLSNFVMFCVTLAIEFALHLVKVPAKTLMEIEKIEDITEEERKTLLKNCLKQIDKESSINRNIILTYVESVFTSQKNTKIIEKRNADNLKANERKKKEKDEYKEFVERYKKQ
jgi:hypothetical protein